MFCVGDLVDRGNDNLQILGKQWHWPAFYSIVGNHELLLLDNFFNQAWSPGIFTFGYGHDAHARNGGKWFAKCRRTTRERVAQQLKALPWTMEVQTEWGTVGMVHAEVPIK